MKVAVIGAGIFGCLAALEAAKDGHEVTLLEKSHGILNGATAKSQNRLHLGLHYPRDLETARQSVDGFKTFSLEFFDAINMDFPNFYAIADEESRVSVREFEDFAKSAGITIEEFKGGCTLPNGVRVKNVSRIWECSEGVIDMVILKEILMDRISESRIDLRLGQKVKTLEKIPNSWRLSVKDEELIFDFIIKCTYSSDSIEVRAENFTARNRIFHKTLIQVIESKVKNFGITIVDGDFLTILPKGFTSNSLAYGPSVSTRNTLEAKSVPENWSEISLEEVNKFRLQIKERIDFWLENWDYGLSEEYLETIRTIEVGVEATDRRTSQLLNAGNRLIEIWSGKIDHALDISKRIPALLKEL